MSYFELIDDERPPENIWHHGERLKEWFAAVDQRRKHPDQQPIEDDIEGPTMRNTAFPELEDIRKR